MKVLSRLISWSYGWGGGMWSMASLAKTLAKSWNSLGRMMGGFAFSAMATSSVAVVSFAMTGDPRMKWESPWMIL